jgi:5-methylcytosine-specific restriction enzyme subunit McrC
VAITIPIRNIYYLLCYAWDRLGEGETVDVSALDSTELADLFATVLIGGTRHLLRRGLEQGYLEHEEELSGIRGRMQLAVSTRRLLLTHGKAVCTFDELSVDTLPNRILKTTMRALVRVDALNDKLRDQLRQLSAQMRLVGDIELNRLMFRRVQLHGNNRYYRFLMSVCEIVAHNLLVDERTGSYKFRDFVRDKRMAKLFEAFVLNLLRIESRAWDVRRERISWIGMNTEHAENDYLPTMETDITVRSNQATLVVDTKYYGEMFAGRYESEKFHSAHVYQLFAYVKNLEARGGKDANARGMLLYPKVHRDVCERFQLHGHDMWVCTIDLTQDWKEIKGSLLGLTAAALELGSETMGARGERPSAIQ